MACVRGPFRSGFRWGSIIVICIDVWSTLIRASIVEFLSLEIIAPISFSLLRLLSALSYLKRRFANLP